MPLSVDWYDEAKTIIRIAVTDPWTYEHIQYSLERTGELLNEVSHPVFSVTDFSEARTPPKVNISELRKVSAHPLYSKDSPFAGSYIVGVPTPIRISIDIVAKVFPTLFRALKPVPTMEAVQEDIIHRLGQT